MLYFAETLISRVVAWNPSDSSPITVTVWETGKTTTHTVAALGVLSLTTTGGPVRVQCSETCAATARVTSGAAIPPTVCQGQ